MGNNGALTTKGSLLYILAIGHCKLAMGPQQAAAGQCHTFHTLKVSG